MPQFVLYKDEVHEGNSSGDEDEPDGYEADEDRYDLNDDGKGSCGMAECLISRVEHNCYSIIKRDC